MQTIGELDTISAKSKRAIQNRMPWVAEGMTVFGDSKSIVAALKGKGSFHKRANGIYDEFERVKVLCSRLRYKPVFIRIKGRMNLAHRTIQGRPPLVFNNGRPASPHF